MRPLESSVWTCNAIALTRPTMQRLTLDQPIPDALARRDRRAGQFRRLPSRPPGGGRPGGAARRARAPAGDRRHLRSAPGAPFPARRAAVPPDHARPARSGCSPRAGADAMLVFEFDADARRDQRRGFRRPSCWPSSIGAAGVVTGEDFTFGKGRGGNAAVLRELGAAHGIAAETVAPVLLDGRAGLVEPDPRGAQGRRSGTATRLADPPVRDRGRGRCTATSAGASSAVRPPTSSSATTSAPPTAFMRCACGSTTAASMTGVANLGVRPMFDPPQELLEARLFDFDGDLYGRTIEVALHALSSGPRESKFDGDGEALKADARWTRRMQRPSAAAAAAACRVSSGRSPRRAIRSRPLERRNVRRAPTKPDYRSHRLPAEDRLSDEGRPAAEGAGDSRALAGGGPLRPGPRRRAPGARSSSSTTARPTPMATCTSATRSTTSSRTWSCAPQTLLGKDAPYVPGWDCHGLPIEWKVEEQYRKKKLDKDQVPIERVPRRMPRLCAALGRRAARAVQAPRHRRRLGQSLPDDGLRGRGDDRRRADEVRRERPALPRRQAGDVVARSRRPRWPRPRSSTRTSSRPRSTWRSRSSRARSPSWSAPMR